jgi:hypothetical protein
MGDRVTVQFGLTKNLGNYESARLDATFSTDVAENETVEDAFERAWKIVDDQVTAKLDD